MERSTRMAVLLCLGLVLFACADDESAPSSKGTAHGGASGEGGEGGAGGSGGGDGVGGAGGAAGEGGTGGTTPGTGGSGGPGGTGGAAPGTGGAGGEPGTGGAGGEPGTGGTGGAAPCPPGKVCGPDFNYAFVTSTTHTGALGGLAEADRICQDRALAQGLPGTYVAWLSDFHLHAKDRLQGASGWRRVDDRPFASSIDDLVNARIQYPLLLDEKGDLADEFPFTGTRSDGTRAPETCHSWTSEERVDKGLIGRSHFAQGVWTQDLGESCSGRKPLYCFGIDHSEGLPDVRVAGRLAFISQQNFQADLGIAAADAICQDEADRAGRTGTFKALLATSAAGALSRFSLAGDAWVRPDGVLVWESTATAPSATSLAPLAIDAWGDPLPAGGVAWTGAENLGAASGSTCGDWSQARSDLFAPVANAGRAGPFWLKDGPIPCNFTARLLCLED